MFYIYLLKSLKDGRIYIGMTKDLKKRVEEHNNKRNFSTKFRAPFILLYYEAYYSIKDAKNREKSLKHYGQGLRRLKERLKFGLFV